MIKLSIVIAIYNVEKYLRDCLQSCVCIKKQEEYEVICIDDGSTDGSPKILDEYRSYDNFNIIHTENHGVSRARNLGISVSKGKYIWFVDGDDFIENHYLESLIDYLDNNEPEIMKFRFKRVYEKTSFEAMDCFRPLEAQNILIENVESYFEKDEMGFVWSYVAKKSIYVNNNISFPEDVIMCEDEIVCFFLRAFCKEIVILSNIIYYYRVRSGSVTSQIKNDGTRNRRYIESRINLAEYNSRRLLELEKPFLGEELKRRILYDVQGAISMSISIGNLSYTTEVLNRLTEIGLYPYKFPVHLFKPHGTIKKYLIDILAFFYPIRGVVKLYTSVYGILNRIKSCI